MGWIQTASGRRVDLVFPDPGTIDLEDVARSLGGQCRYFGGTTRHYSVADHSCRLAWALLELGEPSAVALSALFHDAPEAFLTDLPYPLKAAMPSAVRHWWDSVETRMGTAMEVAFALPVGLITDPPKVVRLLDEQIVAYEFPLVMNDRGLEPKDLFEGWDRAIVPNKVFLTRETPCWDRDRAAREWLALVASVRRLSGL